MICMHIIAARDYRDSDAISPEATDMGLQKESYGNNMMSRLASLGIVFAAGFCDSDTLPIICIPLDDSSLSYPVVSSQFKAKVLLQRHHSYNITSISSLLANTLPISEYLSTLAVFPTIQ